MKPAAPCKQENHGLKPVGKICYIEQNMKSVGQKVHLCVGSTPVGAYLVPARHSRRLSRD